VLIKFIVTTIVPNRISADQLEISALTVKFDRVMELPPAWSQSCICGHMFSVPQAYTCHKCSCQKTKKRFSSALEKAKEVWQVKKRRKMEQVAESIEEVTQSQPAENVLDESGDADQYHPSGGQTNG
jgi:hypothetical protein